MVAYMRGEEKERCNSAPSRNSERGEKDCVTVNAARDARSGMLDADPTVKPGRCMSRKKQKIMPGETQNFRGST